MERYAFSFQYMEQELNLTCEASKIGNDARYINDFRTNPFAETLEERNASSLKCNIKFLEAVFEGYPYLFVLATEKIPARVELITDYGDDYWTSMKYLCEQDEQYSELKHQLRGAFEVR